MFGVLATLTGEASLSFLLLDVVDEVEFFFFLVSSD